MQSTKRDLKTTKCSLRMDQLRKVDLRSMGQKKAAIPVLGIEERAAKLYTARYPRAKGSKPVILDKISRFNASNVVSFNAFRSKNDTIVSSAMKEVVGQQPTPVSAIRRTNVKHEWTPKQRSPPLYDTFQHVKSPIHPREDLAYDSRSPTGESLALSFDYVAPHYSTKAAAKVDNLLDRFSIKDTTPELPQPDAQNLTSIPTAAPLSELPKIVNTDYKEYNEHDGVTISGSQGSIKSYAIESAGSPKTKAQHEHISGQSTQMRRETNTQVLPLNLRRNPVIGAQLDTLQSHYKRLQEEYETLVVQRAGMTKQLNSIDGRLQGTQAQTFTNTKDIASLQNSTTTLSQEMAVLKATVEDCQTELHSLRDSITVSSSQMLETDDSPRGLEKLDAVVEQDARVVNNDDRSEQPNVTQRKPRSSDDFETLAIDVLAESGTAHPYRLNLPAMKYQLPVSVLKSNFVEEASLRRNSEQLSEPVNRVAPLHKSKFRAIPKTKAAGATHFLHFRKKVT